MQDAQVNNQPMKAEILLPTTKYYEVKSTIMEADYGVWVTLPVGYTPDNDEKYPVIYVQDGNLLAPFIGCFNKVMQVDVIKPIRPFVTVSIGYREKDANRCSSLRMRDLIPPKEPANPMMIEALNHNVAAGLMTEKERDEAISGMQDNRANDFLNFVCNELHPQIVKMLKIKENDIGLFGYSYGGLFALYSALQPNAIFTKIGACSAGMLTDNTVIFDVLQNMQNTNQTLSNRQLLTTINEGELVSPTFYQIMGSCFTRFAKMFNESPLKGVEFKNKVIPGTTHVTGTTAAWFCFLHEFYAAEE